MAGGRLRTDRSLGIPFDLGASWIHGTTANPVTALAAAAKAPTRELDFDCVAAFDEGGRRWSPAEFATAQAAYDDLLERLVGHGENGVPFATTLAAVEPNWHKDRLRSFFTSGYLTFDTGDLDQLSSTLYEEGEEFDGPEVVMTDGYDRIAQHLAAGLDIRFEHPVQGIEHARDIVTVLGGGRRFEAPHVVLAVPLGVLKAGTIAFAPELPAAKQNAIASVGFNAVDKFLFVWNDTFWDDTDFLVYTSSRPDLFNYFVNMNALRPRSNALMTFAFAAEARASESRSDREMTALVTAHLRDMYGPAVPEPAALRRSAWATDPFTLGSYSFTSVGTRMQHFDELAASAGRVHFAGEHTHRAYFSTVHGAYLSGLRAAKEVLAE